MELDQQGENSESEKDDSEDVECYVKKMNAFKDNLFLKAKCNAQIRQERDYDKRHGKKKVCCIMKYRMICYSNITINHMHITIGGTTYINKMHENYL